MGRSAGWTVTQTGRPAMRAAGRPPVHDRLLDAGALASIGSVGGRYDTQSIILGVDANALAESLIGLYKTEHVRHEGPWRGVDDLELETVSWGR